MVDRIAVSKVFLEHRPDPDECWYNMAANVQVLEKVMKGIASNSEDETR